MFKCINLNKKYLMLIIAVSAFIVLFISYRYDAFRIVKDIDWFKGWQSDSEDLIWTRIGNIENKGFGYKAGLLGEGYEAQIGLQGSIFGLLKLVFGKYIHLYSLTVFLLCICFFYILKWIYDELGSGATIAAYIFLLFNQWMTVSARNLYWVTFTFLLPLIVSLYFLKREEKTGKLSIKLYVTVIFLAVFIRTACGFEMISTILINMEAPLFYYAYKNQWNKKKFLVRFFAIWATGVLAFVACFILHLVQLMAFTNDGITIAIEMMKDDIAKRTGALKDMKDYAGGIYRESLEATKFSVIKKYLFEGNPIIFRFKMCTLLLIYASFASLSFASEKYIVNIEKFRTKLIGILIMNSISIVAPFSWFVLASGHSYIHTTINYILWSLPTLVLLAAHAGVILTMVVKSVYVNGRWLLRLGISVAILLMICLYVDSTENGLRYIKYVTEDGTQIFQNRKVNVYLYEGKLYFISEDLDLSKRFFLHCYPDSSDTLNDSNQFLNYDFNYEDEKIKTPFWEQRKITFRELPNQKVGLTVFGQYEGDQRYWEYSVDLSRYFTAPNNVAVNELTDDNWTNGYNNSENCIMVPYKFDNYYLDGKYIALPDDEEVLITKVEYHQEFQWIYTDRNISQYNLTELTIKEK